MISLERLQSLLTDITSLFQFLGALLGICAIILPLLRTLPFYHTLIYWLDVTITLLFHAFSRLFSLFSIPCSSLEELHQDPLAICLESYSPQHILVSGLSNTGNSCFLNSVLQAVSSLPSLHQYLYTVRTPTSPVSNTLFKTIRRLSKPQQSRSSIRPSDLVRALATKQAQPTANSTSSGYRRRSSFLTNRRQQDAQEFFQVLMDAVDTETMEQRSKGESTGNSEHSNVAATSKNDNDKGVMHDPLSGLLASQLSCAQCGYIGTIRHFSFNNIQLCLPNTYSATIENCLQQYTAMEYLRDATCRQCSLLTTSRVIAEQVGTLKRQAKHTQKNKEKKRQLVMQMVALEKRRMELEQRLRSNQIDSSDDDDDDDDEKTLARRNSYIARTISPKSTKQVMIAKAPPSLCLHMTRSAMHQSSGMIFKNTCQLLFDEFLDLTPFVANGTLHASRSTTSPLSSFSDSKNKNGRPSSMYLYRLMSAVVHYGSHSYGHYIAYKRRILPSHCHCHTCSMQKQHQDQHSSLDYTDNKIGNNNDDHNTKAQKGPFYDTQAEVWNKCTTWYRISDSKVDSCNLDDVLSSNPYMLFYDRVDPTTSEGKGLFERYLQQLRRRSTTSSDDDDLSDSEDSTNNSTDDDKDRNDNNGDEDDDTSSELHQPISPATPRDYDGNDDFTSPYYTNLTGSPLEAFEMANALFNMDRQETPSNES